MPTGYGQVRGKKYANEQPVCRVMKTHKVCPSCRKVRHRDCFDADEREDDGLAPLCKACKEALHGQA